MLDELARMIKDIVDQQSGKGAVEAVIIKLVSSLLSKGSAEPQS
jgi:hypothetical protein